MADRTNKSALTQPGFKRLWAGQSASQLGFQFEGLATPVLAVMLLHASEAELGYLNAANTAAFLLVGLAAGAWVDRWRKRRVMIVADVTRAVLLLAIPALWFTGHLALWHLYVVAGLVGIATVFFDVAYQSYIPMLVEPDAVGDANGKLESTAQVARLGGPALAGVLLQVISAPGLLLANAVGFAASAVALVSIAENETAADPRERQPLVTEIREGLGFVLGHPLLRRIVTSTALSNIGSTMVFTLFPLMVLRILGLDPAFFGLILSLGAVGGLVASVTTTRLSDAVGDGPAIRLSLLVSAVAIALVPLAGHLVPAAILLLTLSGLFMSFGVVTYNIVQVSARQRLCPPRLLGRMNASIRFIVWGIMPLAALAAGWLGSAIGTLPTLWIGAAASALSLLPFVGHYGRLRAFPRTPSDPAP